MGAICTAHKNTVLFSSGKIEGGKKIQKHSFDACANRKPTSCSGKFLHSRQRFQTDILQSCLLSAKTIELKWSLSQHNFEICSSPFLPTQFPLKAIQAKLTSQLFKYDTATELKRVRQKKGTPALGTLIHPRQMNLLLLILCLMSSLTALK